MNKKFKIVPSDDPILHKPTRHVDGGEINAKEVQDLIDLLFEAMRDTGAVGVAANQIGFDYQIAVYGYQYRPEHPELPAIADSVIINPIVEPYSDVIEFVNEGCLSLPNFRGLVPRNRDIKCSFYDRFGKRRSKIFQNLEARIIQHETDHLNGILFVSKVQDGSSLHMVE